MSPRLEPVAFEVQRKQCVGAAPSCRAYVFSTVTLGDSDSLFWATREIWSSAKSSYARCREWHLLGCRQCQIAFGTLEGDLRRPIDDRGQLSFLHRLVRRMQFVFQMKAVEAVVCKGKAAGPDARFLGMHRQGVFELQTTGMFGIGTVQANLTASDVAFYVGGYFDFALFPAPAISAICGGFGRGSTGPKYFG